MITTGKNILISFLGKQFLLNLFGRRILILCYNERSCYIAERLNIVETTIGQRTAGQSRRDRP